MGTKPLKILLCAFIILQLDCSIDINSSESSSEENKGTSEPPPGPEPEPVTPDPCLKPGDNSLSYDIATTLAAERITGNARGIYSTSQFVYVADGNRGLQIYRNNGDLDWVGEYQNTTFGEGIDSRDVFVAGNYAYVADGSTTNVVIVDISNPASPSFVKKLGHATADQIHSVFVSGNHIYIAGGTGGMYIWDISDPHDPQQKGRYDSSSITYSVKVVADYAYLADGYNGLQIVYVSNPNSPSLQGQYNTPEIAYDVDISGSFAYVADGDSGLWVIYVGNKNSPQYRDRYDSDGLAKGIDISGGYAYLADGSGGLKVFKISDPNNIYVTGWFKEINTAEEVFFFNGYALVAAKSNGIKKVAFNYSDKTPPVTTASHDGDYSTTINLSLSINETGNIYYTTNGEPPTSCSNQYSGNIKISETTAVRYFAIDDACNRETEKNKTIRILYPVYVQPPSAPILTMGGGTETSEITWRSNSYGLPYKILIGGTNCDNGVPSTGANATGETKKTLITSTVHVSDLVEGNNQVRICVTHTDDRVAENEVTITRDDTEPVLLTAETLDSDGNGKLDGARLTFNIPVWDSSLNPADWHIEGFSNVDIPDFTPGDMTNDNILYISFDESGGTCSQANLSNCDTEETPNYSYVLGALISTNGLHLSSIDPTPTQDGAGPKLFADPIHTYDLDGNGKIDALKVELSEAVDDSAINPTRIEIAGYSNPFVVSTTNGDTANDRHLYIQFAENTSECNTIGFKGCDTGATPALTLKTGALFDAQGSANRKNGPFTAEDKVAPVFVGAKAEKLSRRLYVQFSEPVYKSSGQPDCTSGGEFNLSDFTYNDNAGSIGTTSDFQSIIADCAVTTARLLFHLDNKIIRSEMDGLAVDDTVTINVASFYDENDNVGSGGNTITIREKTGPDFNGDGIADIALRDQSSWASGSDKRLHVQFGGNSLPSSTSVVNTDYRISLGDNYFFNTSFGDINNDGIDDMLIGLYNELDEIRGWYGSRELAGIVTIDTADVVFTGDNDSHFFGFHLDATGDINNDGFTDILTVDKGKDSLFEESGIVYLYYGPGFAGTVPITEADFIVEGDAYRNRVGGGSALVDDVNGDGFDDILLNGGRGADAPGEAYIFFGSASLTGTVLSNTADVTLLGEENFDIFGWTIAVGDYNGDSLNDIFIDAPYKDEFRSYIFWGDTTYPTTINAAAADLFIEGYTDSPNDIREVTRPGDINGDGFDDILLANSHKDWGDDEEGVGYIFFGSNTLTGTLNVTSPDVLIRGSRRLGYGLNIAGDINEDGIADIAISDYVEDAYLFWGDTSLPGLLNPYNAPVTLVGTYRPEVF